MAIAKKCDRCGKYYDNKNPGFSILKLKYAGDLMGRIELDLCPDCCEQFNKWLNNKDTIITEWKHTPMGNTIKNIGD